MQWRYLLGGVFVVGRQKRQFGEGEFELGKAFAALGQVRRFFVPFLLEILVELDHVTNVRRHRTRGRDFEGKDLEGKIRDLRAKIERSEFVFSRKDTV